MKRVYITGIAGLVGSNLAKKLLQYGYDVTGCDNLIGGYEDNIPSKECDWSIVNIQNCEALRNSMRQFKPDTVIHTAALPYEGLSVFSPKLIAENLYGGTTAVAGASISCGVELFLNCSSMARYGIQTPPFTEDMIPNPVDPYGLAKVHSEEMLSLLDDIHGLKYYTVVPHNIVGPGQRYTDPYRNVIGIMINRLLQGKHIVIYGDGSQKRSFSHINDCVAAIIILLEDPIFPSGEVFNIGPDNTEMSIKDIAFKVGHYCQVYPHFDYFPDRPREVKNAWCSSEKAIKELGYKAQHSIDETIGDMVTWVRQRGSQPFDYRLPIEIVTEETPKTWTNKLI